MTLEDLNAAIKAEEEFDSLEHLLYEKSEYNELCDTGSVTITLNNSKQYIIKLEVEEVK